MGSKCCSCRGGSPQGSVITLADLRDQATELKDMATEETRDDVAPEEVLERFSFVSVGPQEETSATKESPRNLGQDHRASNVLWSTGSFSDPIPNGFYIVIPDKTMRLFKSIPTLDELRALGDEGLKADVILIDFEKDTKLDMLKKLIISIVVRLNSNPVKVIKKIAGLVVEFYNKKRPTLQSPRESTTQSFGGRGGFPLLGQIKPGCCRLRAILFKVLADTVGLESKLVVGFPGELKSLASAESCNHMSIVVNLNTVELMVDLMRSPGKLIPMSKNAMYIAHISLAAGNDLSCHSATEPNSPMYGYMDRLDYESLSRSEPNIASQFLRRSQGNFVRRQRTASSSPGRPYVRTRERFMLSANKKPVQELTDDVSSCKSDEAAKLETRRIRRSLSATPEISDGTDRSSVRAVSESLKQSRFSKERGDAPDDRIESQDLQKNTEKSETLHQNISRIWNEVMGSPMFQNKPLLSDEEWNIDFSQLQVGTLVGIGSFGKVFRGIWNGREVAIKMNLDQDVTVDNIKDFCNEISILSRLRHPNVILFLGVCTKPPQLSLVTEYVEKGSLYHLLHSTSEIKKLSWREKLKMLDDICRGLMYIHGMGIVHRDLKSANCLVSSNWEVKICDFGLSRMMEGTAVSETAPAGTPEWVAPEVIRNEPFSEKCDIFSFGVIMWELCTLSKPWEGVPKDKVIYTVANEGARLQIPQGPLGKLIADCWSEPEQRPTCEEILTYLETCE